MNIEHLAKTILTLGVLLIIAGALLYGANKLGMGRLPGDILYRRGNFTFYFPIATSILLSLLLTILFRLMRR